MKEPDSITLPLHKGDDCMNVEISDFDIQAYAEKRLKERIDQIVSHRIGEINWINQLTDVVFTVVSEKITREICEEVLKSIDRNRMAEVMAKYIVNELFDSY